MQGKVQLLLDLSRGDGSDLDALMDHLHRGAKIRRNYCANIFGEKRWETSFYVPGKRAVSIMSRHSHGNGGKKMHRIEISEMEHHIGERDRLLSAQTLF